MSGVNCSIGHTIQLKVYCGSYPPVIEVFKRGAQARWLLLCPCVDLSLNAECAKSIEVLHFSYLL